ncbi:MAG: hypothetical protein V3S41_08375 [Spirochaetia bacterium]
MIKPNRMTGRYSPATSWILVLALILISSCVTNPITVDTYDPMRPPPNPEVAIPLSLIPGGAQFANGEYIEGAGIIGVLVAATAGVAVSFGPDPANPDSFVPRDGREALGISSMLALIGGILYNMGDGILTTFRRQAQFDAVGSDPSIVAGLVTIEQFRASPLFAARYRSYNTTPPGELVIRNDSSADLRGVRATLNGVYIADAGDPMVAIGSVGSRSTIEFPLTFAFDPAVGALTEETKVPIEFTVHFEINGVAQQRSLISSVTFLGRNTTDWADPRAIASYVNPDDPPIADFAAAVRQLATEVTGHSEPDAESLVQVLHAALSVRDLGWFEDPATPFQSTSRSPDALDSIQLPRETLRFFGGDSDELVTLISALAEACGIESAILFRPGSILVALNVGRNFTNREVTTGLPGDLDGDWLILDPSELPAGMSDLAELGARLFEEAGPGAYEVISIRNAWEKYPPAVLPETQWRAGTPLPSDVRRFLDSEGRQ